MNRTERIQLTVHTNVMVDLFGSDHERYHFGFERERIDNGARYVFLHIDWVLPDAIKTLCPDVHTFIAVDERHIFPHSVIGLAHGTASLTSKLSGGI